MMVTALSSLTTSNGLTTESKQSLSEDNTQLLSSEQTANSRKQLSLIENIALLQDYQSKSHFYTGIVTLLIIFHFDLN